MAPMLALHETAPERLRALIGEETDGIVTVRLPGLEEPLRVDRAAVNGFYWSGSPITAHGFLEERLREIKLK